MKSKTSLASRVAVFAAVFTLALSAGSAFAGQSEPSQSIPSQPTNGHTVPDGGATGALVLLGLGAMALLKRAKGQ